jgi:hypothetical protein
VTESQGGGVVIEYGQGAAADREVLRNIDLFDIPQDARFDPNISRFTSSFKGETAVTSALIRLREGTRLKIAFTTGHKEPSLEAAGTEQSLSYWRARLGATGWDAVAVNLLTEDVPEDAALLVIAGPQVPFKPDEVDRLRAYANRKKPLLVLLGDLAPSGLEDFLKGFSIVVGKGLIVEPRLNFRGRADALIVPVTGQKHPLLAPLNNSQLLFLHASPLKVETGDLNPKATPTLAEALLRTSPASWIERDTKETRVHKDPGDEPGPAVVAMAVHDRPAQGETAPGPARMVVFSSGYLASNLSVQIDPENLDLLMNAVNWLRGRVEMEGIFPKSHVSLTLDAADRHPRHRHVRRPSRVRPRRRASPPVASRGDAVMSYRDLPRSCVCLVFRVVPALPDRAPLRCDIETRSSCSCSS